MNTKVINAGMAFISAIPMALTGGFIPKFFSFADEFVVGSAIAGFLLTFFMDMVLLNDKTPSIIENLPRILLVIISIAATVKITETELYSGDTDGTLDKLVVLQTGINSDLDHAADFKKQWTYECQIGKCGPKAAAFLDTSKDFKQSADKKQDILDGILIANEIPVGTVISRNSIVLKEHLTGKAKENSWFTYFLIFGALLLFESLAVTRKLGLYFDNKKADKQAKLDREFEAEEAERLRQFGLKKKEIEDAKEIAQLQAKAGMAQSANFIEGWNKY